MTTNDTHRAVEAVWRIESAKLIAALARITRDIGLAEELAQDALVAALESWPESGVPERPAAWLMAAAKRRAIDLLRARTLHARKHEQIGRELEVLEMLAAGSSNQVIASQLVVTLDTVKKHVSHLLGKLGAANRTEAVARARELGLIP